MQRPITGFHKDEHDDWVAELSCGHGQHVRHKPPFQLRPWVTSAEGRRSKLGQPLACLRCDRRELPDGWAPYKRTAELTNENIPRGLLREHSLKAGTWGRLWVLEGRLAFRALPQRAETMVTPEAPLHIPPELVHEVSPLGPVRFFIEFLSRPTERSAPGEGGPA